MHVSQIICPARLGGGLSCGSYNICANKIGASFDVPSAGLVQIWLEQRCIDT